MIEEKEAEIAQRDEKIRQWVILIWSSSGDINHVAFSWQPVKNAPIQGQKPWRYMYMYTNPTEKIEASLGPNMPESP